MELMLSGIDTVDLLDCLSLSATGDEQNTHECWYFLLNSPFEMHSSYIVEASKPNGQMLESLFVGHDNQSGHKSCWNDFYGLLIGSKWKNKLRTPAPVINLGQMLTGNWEEGPSIKRGLVTPCQARNQTDEQVVGETRLPFPTKAFYWILFK